MGIFDSIGSIFGGGGGTKTTVREVDPFQGGTRDLLDLLNSIVTPELKQLQGGGFQPFQGQRVAPFNQLQQGVFGVAGGLPGLAQQQFGQLGQQPEFLGGANQLVDQLLQRGVDPAVSRQFQREAFIDPAREFFQQDVIPQTLERFAGLGIAGSPVAGRELASQGRRLTTDLASQLAQATRGDIGFGIQGAQLGQQLAGLPGDLFRQGFGNLSNILGLGAGFGGQQQQQAQAQIGAQRDLQREQQPVFSPLLQQFLSPALQTGASTPLQALSFQQQGAPGFGAPLGAFSGQVLGQKGGVQDLLENLRAIPGLGGLFG